ncbi:MAG: tetratricopeptide repeat protein [Cyanobacteria bacterium P01_E01_bin.35]
MSINRQSSTLIPLDKKSESKFHHSPKSLALVQSAQKLDRPTTQQKEAVARIYAEQAWIYFQEHNWQQAIVACKNALENDAQNANAYKILGNVLKVQGKKAEALGVYAKALAINPDSAPIYANLGSFYAEQKNWRQALDYFQQAVILDPCLAGAYRSLAQIWEELGDSDQALECFCRAVDLEPERLTAEEYFSFGKELYQQGRVKEASIFYTHGVKLNPRAEAELAQLVKIFEELEEWQQAVVYYQRLISLSNDDLEFSDSSDQNKPIKNLLSRSKSKSKSQNAADLNVQSDLLIKSALSSAVLPNKSARKSGKFSQSSAGTADLAVNNSSAAKLLPEAKAGLATKQKSPTKQPTSAISWNNLGSLYAQKQQWTRAISCYQEAVELDPNLCKTYRNLARVYSKTEKELQSNLCWYKAFSLEPEAVKPEDHFNLARKLLQQQEVDKAIACLRRTVQLKPNFNRAYLILGKLFEKQGKPEAAQACYEKVKHNNSQKNSQARKKL